MMYLVLAIKTEIKVTTPYGDHEIPFESAGFFGVCPVFRTKEAAEEWADGKLEVFEVSEVGVND